MDVSRHMLGCSSMHLYCWPLFFDDALSFLKMHVLRYMQNSATISDHVAYKKIMLGYVPVYSSRSRSDCSVLYFEKHYFANVLFFFI